MTVFAIEGDTIAIREFHARPLHGAIARDTPSDCRTVPGHRFAFVAPFPKWLTAPEEIPVARDPGRFERSAFLKAMNAGTLAAFGDD